MRVVEREVEVEKALVLGEVRKARLQGRVRARSMDSDGSGGIVGAVDW